MAKLLMMVICKVKQRVFEMRKLRTAQQERQSFLLNLHSRLLQAQ
jgi:hypothetical protein